MLTILPSQAGQRIDNFLLTHMKGVPRTRIYKALRKGEVRVNSGRVNAMYRLKAGDEVRIPPIRMAQPTEQPTVSDAFKKRLMDSVLFENDDLIVINKPAGVAVHAGTGIHIGLIEAFSQIFASEEKLYLVHRLDRDTSGCLLLAKHREAMLRLQTMMRNRDIEKQYLVLVHGKWPKTVDRVNAPLLKKTIGDERMVVVDEAGRLAETRFDVIQYLPSDVTLLRATLVTGRMHQIRVHAQHIGHPIVGDRKYGDRVKDKALQQKVPIKRLFLHAKQLSFHYPTEDSGKIEITAPGFDIDDFTRITKTL